MRNDDASEIWYMTMFTKERENQTALDDPVTWKRPFETQDFLFYCEENNNVFDVHVLLFFVFSLGLGGT